MMPTPHIDLGSLGKKVCATNNLLLKAFLVLTEFPKSYFVTFKYSIFICAIFAPCVTMLLMSSMHADTVQLYILQLGSAAFSVQWRVEDANRPFLLCPEP